MKQLALFTLICLTCSFACSKQEAFPDIKKRAAFPGIEKGRPDSFESRYFIKRYVGFLGNDNSIPLDLLLVNWGNGRLSGQTYYPNHYGILPFEGTLAKDGSFELKELKQNKLNATFIGKMHSRDNLSGNWWNIDRSKNMSFHYTESVPAYDYDHWTGVWHLNDPWDTAMLIIGGVTETDIQFAMNIYINGYREQFYGTANLRGQRAVLDELFFPIYRENCKLVFYRRDREIYLEQESFPFLCDLGINCWTTGVYQDIYTGKTARIDFIGKDSVFKDRATYDLFYKMVGEENLSKFAYNMERLERASLWDKDYREIGSIWKGRVRGFHREKEGIIVYNDQKEMWAATTSPPDSFGAPMSVHYFTNTKKWKRKLPEVINEWLKDFVNCRVVFEK